MKKDYKNVAVKIKALYCIDGDYIVFDANPLHNKVFTNVNVSLSTEILKINDISFEQDVIKISGQEPISCELVKTNFKNNLLVLEICQDWG